MEINQISQLLQSTLNQVKTNGASNDNNNAFELLLQEALQSSGNQNANNPLGLNLNGTDLINSINPVGTTGADNKITTGLDSISSLNPQKIAQILQIMQISLNNSVMTAFDSGDDSDGDSDSSSDGLGMIGGSNPMGEKDDITQLLQTVLQNQESSNSNTSDNDILNEQL